MINKLKKEWWLLVLGITICVVIITAIDLLLKLYVYKFGYEYYKGIKIE